MTLALICLVAVSLVELSILPVGTDKVRRPLAIVLILGLIFGSVSLLIGHPATWTVLIAVVSLYRIVNLLRIVHDHRQPEYLVHVTWRSTCWLIIIQLVIGAGAFIDMVVVPGDIKWWDLVVGLQLIAAATLVASTNRHIRTTTPPKLTKSYADRDLPTLSVLIPARNETDELDECLSTIVASNYPKLEVIVLDDCSQNTRTPEIIRGFAHDGIRFISGQVPADQWLAKNFAYEQLADEANGELLLFCGVDARFTPESFRVLVETMITKKKSMFSVIPRNIVPKWRNEPSMLVQPCRYGWELALPRRLFGRPPVLSTCWLIKRTDFEAAGTFKAVSRSVSPERYFARYASTQQDGYSFIRSDDLIGLSSAKDIQAQRATAIRTRYPQLHRRLELTVLVSLLEVGILIVPFFELLITLITGQWLLAGASTLVCILLINFYVRIVSLTYQEFLWRSVWLEPLAALYDVCLLTYSMWRYEFAEVVWKGRNICIPVMRVIPRLPKLD